MSKRDKFWADVPTNSDGDVAWPKDQDECRELASDIVGARVIGAIEWILEDKLRVAAGQTQKLPES